MNIYLIRQGVNDDYDTYDSAIVAAETGAEAQRIHPRKGTKWDGRAEEIGDEWCDAEHVTATHIGTGYKGDAGVILASYHAG